MRDIGGNYSALFGCGEDAGDGRCLVRVPYIRDDNKLKGLEETGKSNERFKQYYLLGKVSARLLT